MLFWPNCQAKSARFIPTGQRPNPHPAAGACLEKDPQRGHSVIGRRTRHVFPAANTPVATPRLLLDWIEQRTTEANQTKKPQEILGFSHFK
jgi:hypothetical protein